VQKVQPNDKSGKLLPNNHTQGRTRAPGHLMSKGLRAASRQTKGEPRQSRSLPIRGGRRLRSPAYRTCDGVAGSAPESLSPHLKFFCKNAFPHRKATPFGGRNRFWTRFCERGHEQFSESNSPPYRGSHLPHVPSSFEMHRTGVGGQSNRARSRGTCPAKARCIGRWCWMFLWPRYACRLRVS